MGGIGYALNDDLHVVYTRSSAAAGQYPSSYGAYQSAKAANNSLSTRGLLSAGTGNYPGTRWGDYVGVAQDPQVPNAVWQGNEYSAGANSGRPRSRSSRPAAARTCPSPPVRVLDTRLGTRACPGRSARTSRGRFRSRAPRDPGQCGRGHRQRDGRQPDGGRLPLGHPTPVPNPPSSTINFPLGDNRANNMTMPLAGNGKLAAVYKAPAGQDRPTSSSTSPATSSPATPARPTRRSPRSGSSTRGRRPASA